MKKWLMLTCSVGLALGICAATRFDKGLSDAGAPYGCRITGAIVVSTNATATCTVKAVYEIDKKAVTNELYSMTCASGVATNGQTRIVAPNAKILVSGESVYLFQE